MLTAKISDVVESFFKARVDDIIRSVELQISDRNVEVKAASFFIMNGC
jgi:hypothetical protein